MSDSEGESCDGYDSVISDEEQPNSEDERFIASSDEESASDWESDDQQRRDAEVFHQEAIDAVRAMRQRRRSRRKKQEAMEVADAKVRESMSRPVQRPAKRRCISATGNRWTKQWWKKKKEVKVQKSEYVTCAHASCPHRVHAGTLYCKTHSYNVRLQKKVFSRKKSVVKKKRRLEDLKEEMRIFNRYEDLRKRAFPAKTKASSCAKCGQRRVGLFYCADHSQMECLRKRLGGRTRESIHRDLEAVRSREAAAAGTKAKPSNSA